LLLMNSHLQIADLFHGTNQQKVEQSIQCPIIYFELL
jgi:hypothetical protein